MTDWTPAPATTLEQLREVLQGPYLVLDTETTGLDQGEIVQIAIADHEGRVLLDTFVRPVNPIPPGATAIHGITDAMCVQAPTWLTVRHVLLDLLLDQDVIVYNAVYDRKMFHKSDEAWELEHYNWRGHSRWWCAMQAYAEFWGDWNSYHQSYRWQKLSAACRQQGEPVQDAHNALGDVRMTLALLRAMKATREG